MTTIKELYEWAIKNNAENLAIGLKYQGNGGSYNGDTFSDIGADYEISVTIERVSYDTNTKYVLIK